MGLQSYIIYFKMQIMLTICNEEGFAKRFETVRFAQLVKILFNRNILKISGSKYLLKIFQKIFCRLKYYFYLCSGLNDEGSPHSLLVISFSVINYVVSRVVAREGHNSFLFIYSLQNSFPSRPKGA